MGLAASQARMLFLTGRKSDIEGTKGMMGITNDLLALSRDSAKLSEQYEDALNATKLVWKTGSTESDLSYNLLMGATAASAGGADQYILTNASRTAVILDSSYASKLNLGTLTRGNAAQLADSAPHFADKMLGVAPGTSEATLVAHAPAASGSTAAAASANRFLTSYNDSDVMTELKNTAKSYSFAGLNTITNGWASGGTYDYTDTNNTAICFAGVTDTAFHSNSAERNQIGQALGKYIDVLTGNTAAAVLAVIARNMGAEYNKNASSLSTAASKAQEDTRNFYKNKVNNDQVQWSSERARENGNNANTIASVSGTNQIWCNGYGDDEFYFDVSQVIKTFLAFFDAACANLDGYQSTRPQEITDVEIGGSSTSRRSTGGTASFTTNAAILQERALAAKTAATSSASLSAKAQGKSDAIVIAAAAAAGTAAEAAVNAGKTDAQAAVAGKAAADATMAGKTSAEAAAAGVASYTTPAAAADVTVPSTNITVDQINFYTNIYNAIAASSWQLSTQTDDATLQNQVLYGNMFIMKHQSDGGWADVSTSDTNSPLSMEEDTEAQSRAEVHYKDEKSKLDYKEKMLDVKMKNLDAERSEITTEIESVNNILKKNIESLKMFDA